MAKANATNQTITALPPQQLQASGPNTSIFRPMPSTNAPQIRIPSPFTTPPGPANASGGRPPTFTPSSFQKVQEVPEVKAAREAFMQAQKKYSEAMKKAMASANGTVATTKTGPITIQIPPAGSMSNGMVQVK
ncbi:MAG: hypothetical protein WA117_02145 [Verrucomicrobiia bacterium]